VEGGGGGGGGSGSMYLYHIIFIRVPPPPRERIIKSRAVRYFCPLRDLNKTPIHLSNFRGETDVFSA